MSSKVTGRLVSSSVHRLLHAEWLRSELTNADGLEVKFLPQELRTDDNWLYHDWKLIGVPTIYRVTRGARAGTPISYSEDGFGKELEAFTTGPEAFDAYLKKTKGDDYKDDDALWAAHLVEFDEVEELIRKHVESEKAKKLKEAKEPEVVCTDGVCTIKPGSGRVRS